eukprot:3042553-Rhodomonas_salina.2
MTLSLAGTFWLETVKAWLASVAKSRSWETIKLKNGINAVGNSTFSIRWETYIFVNGSNAVGKDSAGRLKTTKSGETTRHPEKGDPNATDRTIPPPPQIPHNHSNTTPRPPLQLSSHLLL